MENSDLHKSVLKDEVIGYLNPKPNENFIDANFGAGGHAKSILERTKPKGKLLGIELDKSLLEKNKNEANERLILVNDNFKILKKIVRENDFKDVSGIIFDLGFSSWHIEKSERGFSFQKNEILDMRYDKSAGTTAMDILNKWREEEIEKVLKEYGQERFSRKIAKAIIERRKEKPIIKTFELVEVIKKVIPFQKRINPATRTFQALRIAVNEELENLKSVLPQALEILKPDGKIVVISFHSLEDKIVKNFFKEKKQKGEIEILTKKPIGPTNEEIKNNLRSRSAKLRAAIKIK